jgi:membrane associated rhomboid family serine protease
MIAAMLPRLPRLNASKFVSAWLTVTLVASVVAVVDGGWLAGWTLLAPARIWRGELWRLATWAVVEGSPYQLLVTCACLYKFAGDLAPRWGDRRLRRYAVEVLGAAALGTALLGLISDDLWHAHRFGGWAVGDAVMIAWARQYPDASVSLYGLLRLNGRALVKVTIGITVVYALFSGVLVMAPELITCAAAVWYPASRLARRG